MNEVEKTMEIVEKEVRQMPRREFIHKSVMASGALFVGMNVGTKIVLPDLTKNNGPKKAASKAKENCNNGVGNGQDCLPPGEPPNNDDDPEDAPGNPGNKGGFK